MGFAEKHIKQKLIGFGILCCVIFILSASFIYKYWTKTEPVLYLLAFIPWMILYFANVISSKKITFNSIKKVLILKKENNIKKTKMNYIVRAELLEKRIAENKIKIKSIRENIIYC